MCTLWIGARLYNELYEVWQVMQSEHPVKSNQVLAQVVVKTAPDNGPTIQGLHFKNAFA